MNKQNKPILVAIILATLFVLAFIWWPKEQIDTGPAIQQQVRLGLALQPNSALAIIAMDRGFFEAQGLQIEARPFPSGKRALLEGLLPGEVDIAISADIPVMLQSFKHGDLSILAAVGETSDVNTIVARRDAGISVAADLKGKRIATQKASAVHYFLHLFLRKHGIPEDQVDSSFMKAEQLPKALEQGAIDAFSMREPYIGEALRLLGDQAVSFSAPGIYPQTDMVVTRQSYIQNNPGVIRALIQGLLAAERFTEDNPGQAMELVAQRLGADPDLFAERWPSLDLGLSLKQPLVLLLESQARWALREGLIDGGEIPAYASRMHLDTLRELKPEAVTVIR